MDNGSSDDRKTKGRFLWGTVLTWALSIPFVIGMLTSFRGISEQKATGLGAVVGGLAGSYATFGIILAFVLPVVAILLLIRSFSSAHGMRSLVSLPYIGWNAIMLMGLAAVFVWLRHLR
jgi:uncharacterized protein YybS (DUF2232 family)